MTTTTFKTTQQRATDFDHNYHYSEKHSSSNMPEYVRHNLDVYNEVNGLSAVYQTGQSYYHGDYSLPSTEVELSRDGGTDTKLIKVNELSESDFDDEKCVEYIKELTEELGLESVDDLHNFYLALMDNNALANRYGKTLEITPVFQNHE